MSAVVDTPFEEWVSTWHALKLTCGDDRAERAAAVRSTLRWAGDREDDARTVLMALGLIADPLHKPPTNRNKHYEREG